MLGFTEEQPKTQYGLIHSENQQPKPLRSRCQCAALGALVMVLTAATIFAHVAAETSTIQLSMVGTQIPSGAGSQLTQLSRDGDGESRDDHESRDGDDEEQSSCAKQFEQCAGMRNGKKIEDHCCRKGHWCAHFGDWWGMCVPDKPYDPPGSHHNYRRQDHHHGV